MSEVVGKEKPSKAGRILPLSLLALAIHMAAPLHAQAQESANAAAVQAANVHFNVPAQALDDALLLFAKQADIGLFIGGLDVAQQRSTALRGNYSVSDGLNRLLNGTDFSYRLTEHQGRQEIQLIARPSDNADAINLGSVEVISNQNQGSGDWVFNEPRSVSVITRESIDKRPPRHAADMLEQTTGVYSSVSQQDPSLSVNIRGIQDFGRVNMNIDGVRQNYQKTGYGQRNGQMYIDPDLLTAVTIDKGATNVMGSAGTLGGVATFSTYNASDILKEGQEIGGKVRLGAGNNGTHFIGSGLFAAGNEVGDILLGVSRRNFGDYRSGSKGDMSGWSRVESVAEVPGYEKLIDDALKGAKIANTGYSMDSYISKLGFNLPNNQRLQFGYVSSKTDTDNAGTFTVVRYGSNILDRSLGWKNPSHSDVTAQQATVDYSIRPDDQDWLDLKAKFYYADTKSNTRHYGSPASFSGGSFKPAVIAYDDRTRLKTYGFQVNNTSGLFHIGRHDLAADYGSEIFHDKTASKSTDKNSFASGATPEGQRTLASLFGNLNYNYSDWLEVQGGLRYDRYRLKGDTSMTYNKIMYTEEDPCTERRVSSCKDFIKSVRQEWSVDEVHGRFSPSLFVGVKPGLDWLQVFASYGKSWRPPAITEVFASGTARAGDYYLYPNPLLKAERARSWELGFNIVKAGLFTPEDQLGAKVAYFNTSAEGYISMIAGQARPGYDINQVGTTIFQNNVKESRFRGIEYLLSYDAGFVYGVANFTQMMGRNEFCYPIRWLGGYEAIKGSAGNWYGVPVDTSGIYRCGNSALFSSNSFIPGARGSVTLGGRAFDRKLDFGVIMRFTPGYQDKSTDNAPYIADWPSYKIFDIYTSYPVGDNFIVRAAVDNVTDKVYRENYSDFMGYAPSRGRTVQASIEYNF